MTRATERDLPSFKDQMARHRLRAPELLRRSTQLESGAPGSSHGPEGRPSGRPLSPAQLCAAWEGRPLRRRVRGKLLRAVNAALARRGAAPLTARELFAPRGSP